MKIIELLEDNTLVEIHPVVLRNRSFITEEILLEQLLYENFLDSAKQFLGNKFSQTIANIKGGIDDLIDAGVLIKEIVQDPKYLDSAVTQVGRRFNEVVNPLIQKINSFLPALPPAVSNTLRTIADFIKKTAEKIISIRGWVGFLLRLGGYGFLKYLSDKISNITNLSSMITDNTLNVITDKLQELLGMAGNITMQGLFAMFGTFAEIKKYIFDVLTFAKQRIASAIALFSKKAAPPATTESFYIDKYTYMKIKELLEAATAGATSSGSIATVTAPQLSPGPARGKKSYTGTPGRSGTKAPPQPKVKQPKTAKGTAKNALDMKANIFGEPLRR